MKVVAETDWAGSAEAGNPAGPRGCAEAARLRFEAAGSAAEAARSSAEAAGSAVADLLRCLNIHPVGGVGLHNGSAAGGGGEEETGQLGSDMESQNLCQNLKNCSHSVRIGNIQYVVYV